MKLPLRIAKRYLFSKKSTNAINIIAGIATIGMGVGTAVLIIILSVFNGFEEVVLDLYNDFYPDVEVLPVEGKTFVPDSAQMVLINDLPSVGKVSLSLTENAHFQFQDRDYIATLKGVDSVYAEVTGLANHVVLGDYIKTRGEQAVLLLGVGVYSQLRAAVEEGAQPVMVSTPKPGLQAGFTGLQTLNRQRMLPVGVFAVQPQFDDRYAIAPLASVQRLLRYSNQVSAMEISVAPNHSPSQLAKELSNVLGPDFTIKTRFEQDAELYKVLKTERWAIFAILSFILFIISFNITSSLSMLVIEKRRDIGILRALGMKSNGIRSIFFFEGMLNGILGAVGGLLIGSAICLAQMQFGFIRIDENTTFILDAYPVLLRWSDIVFVLLLALTISVFASLIPALRASKIDSSL